MPRRNRCVLAGVPCHITQRGVDGRETFSADSDRETYLSLLRRNMADTEVRVLGWCLMTNHVHMVAIPAREDSLAVLLRRVHGRYSQYYNARYERSGHLWQNRYFACLLGPKHLWAALAYVEQNPIRAGLVNAPEEYCWSSATAHLTGRDVTGIVDLDWWRKEYNGTRAEWAGVLGSFDRESVKALRQCTHAGRPYGEAEFVSSLSERFERHWAPGRPRKPSATSLGGPQLGEPVGSLIGIQLSQKLRSSG
jgi:putative transposase